MSYSKTFDSNNIKWNSDWGIEGNRYFLKLCQNYFNDLLKVRGYVYLDEVLDYLGFDVSGKQSDRTVGWLYNSKDGDGYIDFGLSSHDSEFDSDAIILDFNVDGQIDVQK